MGDHGATAFGDNSTLVVGGASTQLVAGVVIGLPTMEIYINQMVLSPGITGQISSNSSVVRSAVRNNNATFGTIEMDGITFSILNGWVEIAPTGTK
jgi:hypothetical protein